MRSVFVCIKLSECECEYYVYLSFMVANISEHSPPQPSLNNKGQTTTLGTSCPTLCDKRVGSLTVPANLNIEDAGDGAYGL